MKQLWQLEPEQHQLVEDVSNLLCCESNVNEFVPHQCILFDSSILVVPEIESTSPLQSLSPELTNYRKHMLSLLQSWEKDNMLVYFNKVSKVEVVVHISFASLRIWLIAYCVLSIIPLGPTISSSRQSSETHTYEKG